MYRTNQHVDWRLKSGIFSFKLEDKVDTWKSTAWPSSSSILMKVVENVTTKFIRCDTESWTIHFGWHLSRGDGQHIMQTHPTWTHALRRRWIVCVVWFLFCSHTFVVWVNSLRSVDLTRNVTAGEGTGQVNINPDKSTMAGWNFDRIIVTINTEHHNIQYNPATGSTNTKTT